MFSSFFFVMFIIFFIFSVYMMTYDVFILDVFTIFISSVEVSVSFCFDYVSLMFFFTISLISCIVFMYSSFYMNFSNSSFFMINSRFLLTLFFFVLSMFFLVFSYSWVSLMLGWDGLGVVSFILVIYYNNKTSLNSGLITIFTNRIGDCFFLVSVMFLFCGGWVSWGCLCTYYSFFFLFLIIMGCFTKSAQIPFSSWLPFAMAAPTPVSSLVHSSTLVTAGVYVLIRFGYFVSDIFFMISFISLLTMFISGLCSVLELDFKKIVAMSTLSQLGFMVFTFSMGYSVFCFIHMMFHAYFKSMLFLSTGSLMHLMSGDQDSRGFGCMLDSFYSKVFFNCSCYSLMGIPFTLGFYSKDVILGFFLFYNSSFFIFMFIICCCFTVSYSFRLIQVGSFLFSSFSPSFSFTECKMFFIPVFFLFIFSVFFGNFVMFYFLPVIYLSFFDLFSGILIILLGFFFSRIKFSYFLNFYFLTISFVSLLSTDFLSSNFNYFSYLFDYTWGEKMSGIGLFYFLHYLSRFFFLFFNLYFWSIPVFIFYYYMLFIFVESLWL